MILDWRAGLAIALLTLLVLKWASASGYATAEIWAALAGGAVAAAFGLWRRASSRT